APLKYEVFLMAFEGTYWKYNHEGHDLTWPDWHQRSYDDSSWSNGVALFDGTQDSTTFTPAPRASVGVMAVMTEFPLRDARGVTRSSCPCYFFGAHSPWHM